MKTGEFKVLSEWFNVSWLADLFGLSKNRTGIDLSDSVVGVEVKCKYEVRFNSWAVHEYQNLSFPSENKGRTLFWAFIKYGLDELPEDLKSSEFEKAIVRRHAWIVDWSDIGHLPVSYPKTGPYIYVKPSDLPPDDKFVSFEHNGAIYVPKGSCLEKRLVVPAKQSS